MPVNHERLKMPVFGSFRSPREQNRKNNKDRDRADIDEDLREARELRVQLR